MPVQILERKKCYVEYFLTQVWPFVRINLVTNKFGIFSLSVSLHATILGIMETSNRRIA